ncbi:hypothetical protein [Micromonospora sp. NPDC005305]|uniref:hypothetical protein n=1 Tax=Micromonospora sp. NPDC005305 TaxID=3156875 RepID=UPI0033ABD753
MTDRATVELEPGTFDDELKQLPQSATDYDCKGTLDALFVDSDYAMLMSNPGKLNAKAVRPSHSCHQPSAGPPTVIHQNAAKT